MKTSLEGFVEYDRKRDEGQALKDLDNPVGANGGDSRMVLEYVKKLSDDHDFSTDYLMINCGLHDIKTNAKTGDIQIPLEQYKENLSQIVKLVRKMDVQMIWVNTTMVVDTIHNTKSHFHRYSRDQEAYNEAAFKIMTKSKIPVIDLYSFTKKFGAEACKDHVHFNQKVREKQADFIAGSIVQIINKK